MAKTPTWDTTTDPDNPQPNVYPMCAECKTPFVYRWAMRFGGPSGFFWFRDCKHKKAETTLGGPA